jgi:hypothetical protein
MPSTTHLRITAFAAFAVLIVACGAEVEPPAALPTATSNVPTPTATDAVGRTGGYLGFVGAQNLEAREFPSELSPASPEIEPDLAASIATEFMNDSRIAVGNDVLIDFCKGGKGTTLAFSVANAFVNQPISWMMEPNTRERWNQPTMIIEFDDPELDIPGFHLELVVQAPVNGEMPSWFPSGVGNRTVVFDNPDCGQ